MEDNNLVRRFLTNRSNDNFSALFNEYSPSLMRMTIYLVKRNIEHAEDIVQETWIIAIEKLTSFNQQSTFKTWITGILLNKYREYVRSQKDLVNLEIVFSKKDQFKVDIAIDLRNAILQLPDGYREIMTLHDIEGFKHKEIASILGISEGTSKSQLYQARKSMRNILMDYKK